MLLLTGLGLATKIDPATKEREEARIWITVRILFFVGVFYVKWSYNVSLQSAHLHMYMYPQRYLKVVCVFRYRCHHYYGVKEKIMVLQCFFISPKCFIMLNKYSLKFL